MAINSSSTKKELVEYLRDVHGVDMLDGTKDDLLERISEIEGVDYRKQVKDTSAAFDTPEAKEVAASPRVKIFIPSNESDSGKAPVFASVNGAAFLIKRDVEVEVPEPIVEVLRNAKQKTYKLVDGEMVMTEVPTYPFQIVG